MAEVATVAMVSAGVKTGIDVVSTLAQGHEASKASKAQQQVAQNNAQIARDQASAQRRQGYMNMEVARRQTGQVIGKQRAAAGASGAVADVGSMVDVTADTASQGEIEAVNEYNKGQDLAHNSEIQAMNYMNAANAYGAQAKQAEKSSYLNAIAAGIGGIASMGKSAYDYWGKGDDVSVSNSGINTFVNYDPYNQAINMFDKPFADVNWAESSKLPEGATSFFRLPSYMQKKG